MSADREILKQWIDRAENDLIAAEILFNSNPLILDIACFHCQQSIEKFLKAFLVYNQKEFLLTHNLEYLISLCAEIDSDFINHDLNNLSLYAVRTRYPHDHLAPEKEEVMDYLKLCNVIKGLVLSKI